MLYRALAGRFLIPKREIALPYHRGVLIKKNGQTKVVEAGRRWVWPGERLIFEVVDDVVGQAEGDQGHGLVPLHVALDAFSHFHTVSVPPVPRCARR